MNTRRRASGMGGTVDNYGYRHRDLSRSPSPYRRKRTRSPSPYRAKRNESRSPSPYRHGNGRGHARDVSDQRPPYKRKASPPRGGRPDKRHHADHSRADDRTPKSSPHDEPRASFDAGARLDRRPPQPKSHANGESAASSGKPKPAEQSAERVHSRGAQIQSEPESRASENKTVDAPTTSSSESSQSRNVEEFTTQSGDLVEPVPEDRAPSHETREEKRRRWAAIRAAAEKNAPKENLLQQALLSKASESAVSNALPPAAATQSPISPSASPRIGHLASVPASPDVMLIDKLDGSSQGNSPTTGSPSAADYDPTKDMLDDRDRAAQKSRQSEMPADAYSETNPKLLSTLPAEKVAPVKKQKKEFDMFDFSDDENEDEATAEAEVDETTKGTVLDEKLLDNWDDPEGYYKIISNELVNDGRYRMIKGLGRGVFANVAQAEDRTSRGDGCNPKLVAIKMIRRNDLMRKASQKEMDFLRKVNDQDPQDKQHIIRLLGSFDHKGHLCVVFEHMSKNLRDLLKEDTNGHGLSLQAVRTYTRQMFGALRHMQNCQVVHCDLKPDNILVSADKKTIKLCDFGTAVDKRDVMERTEYLVSRFYRAPEIILGMDIGYGIDMWAIGCTAYELWTGKILFTGRTNNQMIKAFIDCLGWPTERLLKKGQLQNVLEHFEAGPPLQFISREVDQHGNASVRKIEQQKKTPRDIKTRVLDAARGITQGGPTATELNDFADLLRGCLNLNVEKRLEPKEALGHKFFPQAKVAGPKPSVVMKPTLIRRGIPLKR